MLSRSEVIAAFQTILRRKPESEGTIAQHAQFADVEQLCDGLVRSPEFKALLGSELGAASTFPIADLDAAAQAFLTNSDLPAWRDRTLALPEWVDTTLAPDSAEHRAQTLRLWSDITRQGDYRAAVNEDSPEISTLDAIYQPAFYAARDTRIAGGHLMAMGHMILRSGVGPGDRVLEYGAGFGQTALALARMGVRVDTVDINAAFCEAVRANAEFFKVELHPHVGEFGFNPAGADHAYGLVLFYESFHHCLEFQTLVPQLKRLLTPGGRVILAGEPIFDGPCAALPYPWGIRLDFETAAVMRIRGWMELGFQRDYLLGTFAEAGFACHVHTDPNSHWAQIYEFVQV